MPTNSAGLITLFEQRPYHHCSKHDFRYPYVGSEAFMICPQCWNEHYKRNEAALREQRISEQAEAFRRAIEQNPICKFHS